MRTKTSRFTGGFGKKTLDYKGTYKGYLDKRGITAKEFIRNGFYGYRFKISTGSDRVTLETNQYDYSKSCDDAIKIFLSLMGDKHIDTGTIYI